MRSRRSDGLDHENAMRAYRSCIVSPVFVLLRIMLLERLCRAGMSHGVARKPEAS